MRLKNPQYKARWQKAINELRTTDKIQTTGHLATIETIHRNESVTCFCTLGVLAEMLVDKKLVECIVKEFPTGVSPNLCIKSYNDFSSELPKNMRNYFGGEGGIYSHIIRLNDNQGLSFKEIADFLQTALEDESLLFPDKVFEEQKSEEPSDAII